MSLSAAQRIEENQALLSSIQFFSTVSSPMYLNVTAFPKDFPIVLIFMVFVFTVSSLMPLK